MKRPQILPAVGLFVLLTGFWVIHHSDRKPTGQVASPMLTKGREPFRPAAPEFWKQAEVNEPLHFREPTSIPAREDVSTDSVELVRAAIAAGDDAAFQIACLSWFEKDPQAMKDWLTQQPDLADFQSVISRISCRIADRGDPMTGMKWTELMPDPEEKSRTVQEIIITGLRSRTLSIQAIEEMKIPATEKALLLSGAVGD